MYGLLVLIHIVSAVMGLGASFAMPVIMNNPKNAEQAKFSITLNGKVEHFAKIGSILLLVTGLILGFLNPSLFSQGWYITSIAIYLIVQPIVAVIMPKKLKKMEEILKEHQENSLPDSYAAINRELRPYNVFLHSSVVILIILMSLKPF